MSEQAIMTGDWRSNWPGDRVVPLVSGELVPPQPECHPPYHVRMDVESRLELDLLAYGLRTRYCTEPDCINRVTAPGAVTLCDEHALAKPDGVTLACGGTARE